VYFTQIEMKAYLLDLRQKIIDTYFEGEISQGQLAKRFRVALSFVENCSISRDRKYCSKVRIQQTPTKLNQEQLNVLSSIVANNNDATWMNFVCFKTTNRSFDWSLN